MTPDTENMDDEIEYGVYVQAWVWVETGDDNPANLTDEEIRARARTQWHQEGEVEIDDAATISRVEG